MGSLCGDGNVFLLEVTMPKLTDDHVLKVLNSICYRIHTEPESIRSHMRDLSTLLNATLNKRLNTAGSKRLLDKRSSTLY